MALLDDSELPFSLLQFYATSPYPCSYLADRTARSQVATPTHLITTEVYSALVRRGFRRSGVFTYRPWCDHCRACVPVRLPVARYTPDRSQRRALRRNAHLTVRELPLGFYDAHYDLYNRYQAARHPGGGMDQDSQEQYAHFLLQSRVDTRLVEFSDAGRVLMVSVIDVLSDGLSSVYTFFEPDLPQASLGTYNIAWQAAQCQANHLPYLYLGYWIRESPKMAYKSRFRPMEGLIDGEWRELGPADLGLDEPD
ncbi:arginyl-tRNA-protein transferase [Oryzomicrobium terrae]|uniref:Aspartate/glutamate leucyltransferase n=1 Tax=Oryzomicrobium terrae TaxID=1735038 RepID=A0A5C1E9Q6_9RHOO|nr:arginyltransferase [Oryzomicrobium terrae]QEL65415.1 arginyl-tRNA-protein transferase [Oryzomicrobium terrae]